MLNERRKRLGKEEDRLVSEEITMQIQAACDWGRVVRFAGVGEDRAAQCARWKPGREKIIGPTMKNITNENEAKKRQENTRERPDAEGFTSGSGRDL
jgi:hypothetical protein